MKPILAYRRARGFTLIEAIIVMVITGIVAGMVAVFIKTPVKSYMDTAVRAEMSDVADLAIRRISRELRLALPNSLLVSPDGRVIQFLLTKSGGRYIDIDDNPPAAVKPLSFSDVNANTFHMAGAAPTGRQAILPGDFIVVSNWGLGSDPADAYTLRNVASVTAVNGTLITFAPVTGAPVTGNPFAAAGPILQSPSHRFQVVSGAVGYRCVVPTAGSGALTRFGSNTVPSLIAAPGTPVGTPAVLANWVVGCKFSTTQLPNVRASLVTITLSMRHRNGEGLTMVRQVHVDNTP